MRTKARGRALPAHPQRKNHEEEREAPAVALAQEARHWAEGLGRTKVPMSLVLTYVDDQIKVRQAEERAKRDWWRLVGERAKALVLGGRLPKAAADEPKVEAAAR